MLVWSISVYFAPWKTALRDSCKNQQISATLELKYSETNSLAALLAALTHFSAPFNNGTAVYIIFTERSVANKGLPIGVFEPQWGRFETVTFTSRPYDILRLNTAGQRDRQWWDTKPPLFGSVI